MKSLFYGIGVATISGLLIGGALRPTLAEGLIGGPQIALGDSGRMAYRDAEAGTSSYPYGVPDYVIGTDHLYQAASYAATDEGYVDAGWPDAAPDLPMIEPASYTPAAYQTANHDAVVRYPSEGGGILAGLSGDEAHRTRRDRHVEPAHRGAAAHIAGGAGAGDEEEQEDRAFH